MTADALADPNRPATPPALDVSRLPENAYGYRSPLWWGVVLMIAIESTAMSLLLVSYFYVRGNYDVWPPTALSPLVMRLAIVQAILLAISMLPMVRCVRAARHEQLRPTRLWLIITTVFGAAMLVVRGFEFAVLPFHWDSHAYGSIFWMVLGLHVTHLLTSVLENLMLIALLYKGPVEQKHFGDIEASALLWFFSVLEWAPAFAILYLSPLMLSSALPR
jgi:cytochrome c oxidase subunit III